MHTSIIKNNKLLEWLNECLLDNRKKNNGINSKFVFFNSKPQAKRPKDTKSYEITLAKKFFKQFFKLTTSKYFISSL